MFDALSRRGNEEDRDVKENTELLKKKKKEEELKRQEKALRKAEKKAQKLSVTLDHDDDSPKKKKINFRKAINRVIDEVVEVRDPEMLAKTRVLFLEVLLYLVFLASTTMCKFILACF